MATGDKLVSLDGLKVAYDNVENNIVTAQSTQPTSSANRIWFPDSSAAEVEVPTYEEFSSVKSAVEYVVGVPCIKELYITPAGKTAGVTKLHQIRVSDGYYVRFSNGTSYTGHTSPNASPDYGVCVIHSGQSGIADVYGYVIVDWSLVSANSSPVATINEMAYHVENSPTIMSYMLNVQKKLAYNGYDFVNTEWKRVTTDFTLADATDNRFVTSNAFFCKGKLKVVVDNSLVNSGYQLRIMSTQSGKLETWGTSTTITQNTIDVEYNDTIRVSIFNSNGVSAALYDFIARSTCLYTLTDGECLNYLKNKAINTKKIWCFGDSLTAGVITGTTTITETYPYWLKKFLDNDSLDISNFGVPGDTAVNMLAVIQSKTFYQNCDIAIMMIGTNGYMTGDKDDPTTPLGAYHAAIQYIINSGKGLTKIVLMNPPKSIRENVPTRWLDSMHYKIELIAQEYNLDCIDLYQFLPFAPDNTTYYSSDKTHLTAIGYYWIASIVYNYLVNNITAQQIGGSPTFDY